MPEKRKSQIDKFKEAAREHGADDDTDAFEGMVEKIAKTPKLSDEEIKKLAKFHRSKPRHGDDE